MVKPVVEKTLEIFLRELFDAPRRALPPRDPASDEAARTGISSQWRPTPGDSEPPF